MEITKENPAVKKSRLRVILQFTKFLCFSLGAGIIEITSYTVLNEVFNAEIWVCDVVSITLSVLFNFTLNRKFTFKSAKNVPLGMLLIGLFYLVFTPSGTAFILWLVSLNVNEYIAKGLKMALNFVLEFLYCKFVIYRKCENTLRKKSE